MKESDNLSHGCVWRRAAECTPVIAAEGRRLPGRSSTKGIVNTQLTILWMCRLMSSHILMYNSLPSLTFYQVERAAYCPLSSTFSWLGPGLFFLLYCSFFFLMINQKKKKKTLRANLKAEKCLPDNASPFYPECPQWLMLVAARFLVISCCVHFSQSSHCFQFLSACLLFVRVRLDRGGCWVNTGGRRK